MIQKRDEKKKKHAVSGHIKKGNLSNHSLVYSGVKATTRYGKPTKNICKQHASGQQVRRFRAHRFSPVGLNVERGQGWFIWPKHQTEMALKSENVCLAASVEVSQVSGGSARS